MSSVESAAPAVSTGTPTLVLPKRVFKCNGLTFQDIHATLTPQQVLEEYTRNYPFLAHVTVGEPEISKDGSEVIYNLEQPQSKWKG